MNLYANSLPWYINGKELTDHGRKLIASFENEDDAKFALDAINSFEDTQKELARLKNEALKTK